MDALLLTHAVSASPLLAGTRLRWFLVSVVFVGIVVAIVLVRTAGRPSPKQAPPLTKPRLLPDDEDTPDRP